MRKNSRGKRYLNLLLELKERKSILQIPCKRTQRQELNPASMKGQWQNSQGQPRGHSLAHGSYRHNQKGRYKKASCLRPTCVVGLSRRGGWQRDWNAAEGNLLPDVGRGGSRHSWGWARTSRSGAMWLSALTNARRNQSISPGFSQSPDSCLKWASFEANQKP